MKENRKRKLSKPLTEITLYQFAEFDMDKFVRMYLYEINPHEESDGSMFGFKTTLTKKKNGVRNVDGIRRKCMYLQDVIIRKANVKDDSRTFTLNARILQDVIGKEFKTMLLVLRRMGYVELGDGFHGAEKYYYYKPGEYSTLYTMKDVEYKKTSIIDRRIQIYKEQTQKDIIELNKISVDDVIIRQYGKEFFDRYNHSLSLIKIRDEKGLNAFIESKTSQNPASVVYYENLLKGLKAKDKRITDLDGSHRFYHILTNMKRELKEYLSIDFTLDAKNSHALLFNHFIFKSKDIDADSAYAISSSLHLNNHSTLSSKYNAPLSYFRKDRQKACKLLRNSDLEKYGIARLADDEIEYIYKTTNGLLWDEFTEWAIDSPSVIEKWQGFLDYKGKPLYPELSITQGDGFKRAARQVVKREMFRQTFYSPTYKIVDTYDIGKEFAARYPNVFSLIGSWKRRKYAQDVAKYMSEHNLSYNEKSALSVAMMALESEIYTGILQRLFAKRWNALHIHDCIVVPEDGNTNHPSREQVQKVMLGVYQSYGLCPTFD